MDPRAARLVESLGLAPHPEGGHFREIFRSAEPVTRASDGAARRAATQIWFLLGAGGVSRWHRTAGDELWQLVEGGPLALYRLDEGRGAIVEHRLAPLALPGEAAGDGAAAAGTGPLAVVAGGEWQAARALGPYALVTCVVAPGFEFSDFAFAADSPGAAERLAALRPDLASLL
jgi:hypothetical protein